jgi:hypothetical protein
MANLQQLIPEPNSDLQMVLQLLYSAFIPLALENCPVFTYISHLE